MIENKILIAPYLLATKSYAKVINIAGERETKLRQQTDTIGNDMLAVKKYLSTAYHALGNKDKAITTLQEQLSTSKRINNKI